MPKKKVLKTDVTRRVKQESGLSHKSFQKAEIRDGGRKKVVIAAVFVKRCCYGAKKGDSYTATPLVRLLNGVGAGGTVPCAAVKQKRERGGKAPSSHR